MFVLSAVLALSPACVQELMIEQIAQVTTPTMALQAPGDDERLFVASQRSGVYVVKNGDTLETPFLDVESEAGAAGGLHDMGLLSMAFHPDYEINGRFYVIYMDAQKDGHVAEYTVSATDPNVIDTSTRRQILGPYPKAYSNHGFNHLWFGPDGMLYLSIGDDERSDDPVTNLAQDLSNIHGSIVRLDVDNPPSYVPADNPFVGTPGVDERIFAYGLRQPWRSTYDPVSDHVFVADVGNHDSEEISAVSMIELAGANLGWHCYEGSSCTNLLARCPLGCSDPNRVDPVYEYPHEGGRCAIVGGPVYRGAAIPSLYGRYLFADFCTRRVWSLGWDGTSTTDLREHSGDLFDAAGAPVGLFSSFSTTHSGEVLICDVQNSVIWKVIPRPPIANYCETAPNSVGPGARISASGTASVSSADLALHATGLPPDSFGIFFYGPAELNLPAGNGVNCVGSGDLYYFRFTPPETADANGDATRAIDFASLPAGQGPGRLDAGSTWYFQYWYRDPAGGAGLYNFSDGLRVTFQP